MTFNYRLSKDSCALLTLPLTEITSIQELDSIAGLGTFQRADARGRLSKGGGTLVKSMQEDLTRSNEDIPITKRQGLEVQSRHGLEPRQWGGVREGDGGCELVIGSCHEQDYYPRPPLFPAEAERFVKRTTE